MTLLLYQQPVPALLALEGRKAKMTISIPNPVHWVYITWKLLPDELFPFLSEINYTKRKLSQGSGSVQIFPWYLLGLCFYTQAIGITGKLQLPGAMLCWALFRWEKQTTRFCHCPCLQPGGVACEPLSEAFSFLTKPYFILLYVTVKRTPVPSRNSAKYQTFPLPAQIG